MCRVYNTIGSLNAIQYQLVKNNLDEFDTLEELIAFQKDYYFTEQQLIQDHALLVQQEKLNLGKEIEDLNERISNCERNLQEQQDQRIHHLNLQLENLPVAQAGVLPIINDYYRNTAIWLKIWATPSLFSLRTMLTTRQPKKLLLEKSKRFNYICSNFQNAVDHSSASQLQKLQAKKKLVLDLNNTIYGALGEQKVVDTLESLPDDYILINDFSCNFEPPLYNRNENDHIKSIQIDHLLVSPAGIFLIETKNWSKRSIDNLNMRSPVQQVNRTNYALYKILESAVNKSKWKLTRDNWGKRKIPIKNLIVFINNKPKEEFQFVKILALNELVKHIKYFTPSFNAQETQLIAGHLIKISNKREVISKLKI